MEKYRLNLNDGELICSNHLKIDNTNLEPEEVAEQDVKFVSMSELNELRNINQLVPRDEVYDVLSEYLFRM